MTEKDNTMKIALAVVAVIIAVAGGYLVYRWAKNNKKLPPILGGDDDDNDNDNGNGDDDQPPSGKTSVSINANNPSDPYPRDFNVFTSNPDGTYLGDNKYSASGRMVQYYNSGGTMQVSLSKGTYWFNVGVPEHESLGSYSGTIKIGGQTTNFSGVSLNHSVKFVVP